MELRRAAESDPSLLPGLIDLAWGVSGGDARTVEQLLQPQTTPWRLALARAFAKRGKALEAVALFRAAGDVAADERRSLINDLIAAKRFAEAYEVWASGPDRTNSNSTVGVAIVTDGGFEGRINFDDPGFGWQLARNSQVVRVSVDQTEPRSGTSSLRLDWSGDVGLTIPTFSQLVMVEPNVRYRLTFAARTHEIVTGGPPLIVVSDAVSSDGSSLARSTPLPQGTSGWEEYRVEFATLDGTRAVRISLQRDCKTSPCPIFGRIWLDDFNVQRL